LSIKDKKQRDNERFGALEGSLKEDGVDTNIVNIHEGKPGLDVENGKYRVLGTITAGSISTRKGPGTNIAESCGYHVEEIASGRRLMMTKKEGVNIAAIYGMKNAYINYRPHTKKDKDGNVIKSWASIYLQPHPARKESFTQDDRLVSVYKLDENSKIEYPVQLMIKEEQCTTDFWIIVKEMYEKKKKQSRKANRQRAEEEKRRQRILKLDAEISSMDIQNPFDYN